MLLRCIPSQVSIITPIGMKRGQAGRVVHSQHQMLAVHFDSILDVEGAFVFPSGSDESSPVKLLAAALTYVETLANRCNPDAMHSALNCDITEANHCPVRMHCSLTGGSTPNKTTRVNRDRLAPMASGSSDDLSASISASVSAAMTQLLPNLVAQVAALLRPADQPSVINLVDDENPDSRLASAQAKAAAAAADLSKLTAQLSAERLAAAERNAAAAAPKSGASHSEGKSDTDDADDTQDVLGGGQASPDCDALLAQLRDAAASLGKIMNDNDMCSTWVFELGEHSFVGVEPSDRAEKLTGLQDFLRPKFQAIVEAKGGNRTKKAKALLGRLLTFLAGHVADSSTGMSSSSQSDTSRQNNFTFSPKQQRDLLDVYVPLFKSLFPPTKFTGDEANLRRHLLASYPGGSQYFADAGATAILSASSRRQ